MFSFDKSELLTAYNFSQLNKLRPNWSYGYSNVFVINLFYKCSLIKSTLTDGRYIHVVPGPLAYMSYGNGFRLVWLNKGGSMLEPIKYRWWWSNCSLLRERRGSLLCILITPRGFKIQFQIHAQRIIINWIIMIIIYHLNLIALFYFFILLSIMLARNPNKGRDLPDVSLIFVLHSLRLIMMHMKTTID